MLTSCANSSPSGSSETNQIEAFDLPEVSQGEFTIALDKARIVRDEFVGNYEILTQNTKLTKVGTSLMGIYLTVTREDSDSEWILRFLIAYSGDDWMFHEQFNIKSSNGILNVDIDRTTRDDQVESSYVSEISEYTPNDLEAAQMCQILEGEDPKFRIRGSRGEIKSLVGIMTEQSKIANLAMCSVYAGLKQGFRIPD